MHETNSSGEKVDSRRRRRRRRRRGRYRGTKRRVPPTSGPRSSGLVTTSGWYVEPKPFVSSWLTSLSLSLSLHHRSSTGTADPFRPLPRPVASRTRRPAWLSRILFPWFTRARVSKERTVLLPLFPGAVSRCQNLSPPRVSNRKSLALAPLFVRQERFALPCFSTMFVEQSLFRPLSRRRGRQSRPLSRVEFRIEGRRPRGLFVSTLSRRVYAWQKYRCR